MKALIGLLNKIDENCNVTHMGPFLVQDNDTVSAFKLLIDQNLIPLEADFYQYVFDLRVLDNVPIIGVGLKDKPKEFVVAFIDGTVLDK